MSTEELSDLIVALFFVFVCVTIFVLVVRLLLSVIRYFNKKSEAIDDKINKSVDKINKG